MIAIVTGAKYGTEYEYTVCDTDGKGDVDGAAGLMALQA